MIPNAYEVLYEQKLIYLKKEKSNLTDRRQILTRSSPRHLYLGDEYAFIHSDMGDVLLIQVEQDFKLKFQSEFNGISTEV